jgi:hypothetical protein
MDISLRKVIGYSIIKGSWFIDFALILRVRPLHLIMGLLDTKIKSPAMTGLLLI